MYLKLRTPNSGRSGLRALLTVQLTYAAALSSGALAYVSIKMGTPIEEIPGGVKRETDIERQLALYEASEMPTVSKEWLSS